MHRYCLYILIASLAALTCLTKATAQISPGDLAKPHEFLEGLSNCTKCHEIGAKITGDKCLDCHTEIRDRIAAGQGYHSSAVVKGKQCIECHSDHHGKNFQLVHFSTAEFDHNLTGYGLSKPHSKLQCSDCHNSKFISGQKILTKKYTYLGLNTGCLTCHADYHLGTLSSACLNCHGPETFSTAPSFSHDKARFRLLGKHRSVDCIKCHRIENVNGSRFEEFRGIAFASCSNCHSDPHKGKFGSDCRRCHNEESFQIVKGINAFDHNKTSFPLVGRHEGIDCRECHKTKFTDPLKHDNCFDCHADYHKGEFAGNGKSPDCNQCHNEKGFELFNYTIEQHNRTSFPLKGSHLAEPCFECHKKGAEWSFRNIGIECRNCHPDIHKSYIDTRFYPDENCKACHNETAWKQVSFDHTLTDFKLTGAHSEQQCAACHIKAGTSGTMIQKFAGLTSDCSSCHNDNHHGQFATGGKTDCTICHNTDNWKPSVFDHNKTAFRLDGKHINVPCSGCHKPQTEGNVTFTLYKLKDFRCESCHF